MSSASIPKGYKQTEVGVIPEDWHSPVLKNLGKPVRGGSPRPAGDPRYFNGEFIPWLTVAALTNISDHQLVVTDTANKLTELGSKYSRQLDCGDLIIANSGATLGVAKILGIKCCANDGIAAILDLDENVSSEFIAQFINTKTSYLRDVVATGNGQPNLNTELIGNFSIPLPPLPEQRVIAQVLSDTDALIGSLDKLIAKKKGIKQGAMQELLTGRRRVGNGVESSRVLEWKVGATSVPKGYKQTEVGVIPEEWECVKIAEHMKITTGSRNTQDRIDDGAYPFFVRSQTIERINSYSYDGEAVLTAGDGVGTGKVFHYVNGKFDLHQRVYKMSEFSSDMHGYFFYLYFSTNFYARMMSMTAKSSVDSVRREMIADMYIPLPPLAEQRAIAQVLSDMDAEIAELEERREKTKAMKQGLMQVLLTGKVRLV